MPPPSEPWTKRPRQPRSTQTTPLPLPQFWPSTQRVLDRFWLSTARPRKPVLQVLRRLSLLSHRTEPPGEGPGFQPPPPPPSEVAMSCLIRLKVQLERLTWSR